ncbi:major facilitator superfamily domain-containing protein [Aspergillus filifer]
MANFVDRSNVGNAKILGLKRGPQLDQPSICQCTRRLFRLQSRVGARLKSCAQAHDPKFWLPFLVFLTGIIVMCIWSVKTYAHLVVVRALLGTAKGGLYPGSLLFLSTYTREELALRVGIFYSSASLSCAFGGFLARGVSAVPATSNLHGSWRWIFIIEGIITCVIAAGAYPLGPNSIATDLHLTSHLDSHQHMNLNQNGFRRGILSLQLFFTGTVYICISCALFSFSLLLPSIIQSLGYTANEAQLLSVPPYAVASAVGVAVAFLSDRLRVRGKVILVSLTLAIIGFARVTNNVTKYGLTFLMASGIYGSVPPLLVWILNNSAGHYKRAIAGALRVCLANCGGTIAAFLYANTEKPSYVKSHTLGTGYEDDREPSLKLAL